MTVFETFQQNIIMNEREPVWNNLSLLFVKKWHNGASADALSNSKILQFHYNHSMVCLRWFFISKADCGYVPVLTE